MVGDFYPSLTNYEVRENKGSMSYNRLAMQISFAMLKMFELYKTSTFTISLDCIDDVVIFKTSEPSPNIYTYQLKTKDSNAGFFSLTTLVNNNVFLKMYDHIEKLDDDVKDIVLISNLSLKYDQKIISGESIVLKTVDDKLKKLIETDLMNSTVFLNKGFSEKLKFSQVDLSIHNHVDVTKSKFNQLLIDQKIDISLVSAKALFETVKQIFESKQGHEFSLQDKMLTVLPKKSFESKEFEELIENIKNTKELITYKDVIENYKKVKMNLLEESKYKKALASFKDKLNESPNIVSGIMSKVISGCEKEIENGIGSREELLSEIRKKYHNGFEMYFSEIELEILFMNCIEQAIGGIN
ncbi:dsDNA nuclease domain-containing protein [Exiguobacterium flavidum]|uniref:dsDNA nuclease domain-containing protein n=1 Tax=Exiguobacterium flavidum TaxID=2184695 RepID=UPI000DF7F028|nr:dsDNA nuclease domain-containing protein [Exiguobacterium flavidum]